MITRIAGRLPNNSSADVNVALQTTQILAQQLVIDAYYGPFFSPFAIYKSFGLGFLWTP